MEPMVVPTQSVRKDSYLFELVQLVIDWDKITGENKEENYFHLIFTIVSDLGDNYRHYDFFTPFLEWDEDGDYVGFKSENVPSMTKEYYIASFNTIAYVFNTVHKNSGIPERVLLHGVVAAITSDFKSEIAGRDKMIERLKKDYESGRSLNPKGIEKLLNKMESMQYLFNLKNQLQVWEDLIKKSKYINFL